MEKRTLCAAVLARPALLPYAISLCRWLPTNRDVEHIEGTGVSEEPRDLHLLEQVLLSGQLRNERVGGPCPEPRWPDQGAPQRLFVDRFHLLHHLAPSAA